VTTTDDSRLGFLEGRITELSTAVQDLREALLEVNAHIDRLFLAMMAIGATQIGLLITLVVRG
jgi:hypothetical protein